MPILKLSNRRAREISKASSLTKKSWGYYTRVLRSAKRIRMDESRDDNDPATALLQIGKGLLKLPASAISAAAPTAGLIHGCPHLSLEIGASRA
jgi:hypothetical protein